MKSQSTTQFISALVKNLQAVCHGNVEFDQNVKIVGHLFLTVDSATEFNYIVNEKVSKSDESSTTFISKSFYATDQQQKSPKKNLDRPLPQPTPNILGKTRVVNLNPSSDRQFSHVNRFSTSSSYHPSFIQSPHYLSQSKKRASNSRNSSPKVPKICKDPIEIDLDSDSDLLVTFAAPETEAKTQSVEESDNRVPPVNDPSDENVQKYDDYEIFHNAGFDSEKQDKVDNNLSSPLETLSKSPSNLPLSGAESSGHVDLSRVKAEAKENPESGEDSHNNSAFSQDEGDDSNMIKQEPDSDEFFNALREQTMGLNTSTESNFDVPLLPGMSGASYLSVPSTSSDYSKGVEEGPHKNVSALTCSWCLKVFKWYRDKTRHIRSVHMNITETCPYCFATFRRRDYLTRHMRKHILQTHQ